MPIFSILLMIPLLLPLAIRFTPGGPMPILLCEKPNVPGPFRPEGFAAAFSCRVLSDEPGRLLSRECDDAGLVSG